jgi:hypothetical protein
MSGIEVSGIAGAGKTNHLTAKGNQIGFAKPDRTQPDEKGFAAREPSTSAPRLTLDRPCFSSDVVFSSNPHPSP